MKRDVGLWIDHRKAVIVTITHVEDGISRVQANSEKQVCFSEGPSKVSPMKDFFDKKFANYLSSYYADVISCIGDAESIQIFGPGVEKLDLEKCLRHEELGGRIVEIETADKMTSGQIEAKVWQHFLSMR